MLGLGLMYGVAGVVNLGFSQNEQAAEQREKIVTSFTTQYLSDNNFQRLGGLANATRLAQIPFPSSAIDLQTLLNDANSCLTDQASNREGYGQVRDQGAAGFTLANLYPVTTPTLSGDSTKTNIPGNDSGGDSIIEYAGREVYYLTLASGNQLEPITLGEEPMNNVFGHFWVRFTNAVQENFGSAAEKVRIPLFVHLRPPSASPGLSLYLEHDQFDGLSADDPVNSNPFRGIVLLASAPGLTAASVSLPAYDTVPISTEYPDGKRYNHTDNEWLSVSFWVTKAPNQPPQLGLHITDRGRYLLNSASGLSFSAGSSPFAFERNSGYRIGDHATLYAGPNVLTNSSGSNPNEIGLQLATFRVWQKTTGISHSAVSASAPETIEALMEFDAKYPGDYFSRDEMPPLLREFNGNFNLVHYTTFDKTQDDSSLSLSGLNTPLWQPTRSQFNASTAGGQFIDSTTISGNASSAEPFGAGGHAGPPSPDQTYMIHSCDENGYRTTIKKRRYTRDQSTWGPVITPASEAEDVIWREQ